MSKLSKIFFLFYSVKFILAGSLFYLFLFPKPAYAYLDPGTGSYIFQVILASILGIAVTTRTYWKKIFSYFTKNRKSDNEKKADIKSS